MSTSSEQEGELTPEKQRVREQLRRVLPKGTLLYFVLRTHDYVTEEDVEEGVMDVEHATVWGYHIMEVFTFDATATPRSHTRLLLELLDDREEVRHNSVGGLRLDQTTQVNIAQGVGDVDADRLVQQIGLAVWGDAAAYTYWWI